MKRFLLSFVFLLSLFFAFSGADVFGQGREGGGKDREVPPILKGQEGIIDDLANAYCESSASPEIYVNPTNLPSPEDYDYVVWELYYYDGGGNEVYRNDLLNPIGSSPNNGVELDIPEISAAGLFNNFLVIEYSFRRGLGTFGGDFDYTIVRKDPEQFDLTIDKSAVCLGETATLTLDGSEVGYLYYLYRDGVQQNTVGRNGTGDPIGFIQSSLPVGTYSYYVVAHVDDDDVDCETQMNGTPSLSVYPNPSAAPDYRPASGIAGDPICQGLPFELFDGNPETLGYVYTWFGPGLDAAGVTGHTITMSDATVLANPGDYTYDLVITDTNNPTNCEGTASVTVTVQGNPTAAPTINPVAVCEGIPVDINANASGGTSPYSYTWSTADNPSFSTVDQATITINPTTLDDDGDVYSVVVTDALGCVSAATNAPALVVNEEPSVTISGPSEVCEENPITFTATDLGSGFEYQWFLDGSPLGTGTSITLGGGTYALPAVGTDYTISVEVTNTSTTCSTTESTLFTVNDKPEVSISDPLEVCNGTASFTLTADFDNGEGVFPDDYNIQWYKGGSPLTGETTETLTLNNIDENDEATYTVTVEHATTGCSDSFAHALTVHTINPTLSVSPSEIICADQNVTFTAAGTDALEYRFLLNGAEVQAFSTDDTWESNALADGDEVTVEITDVNGCSDISAPITMTVNERPTVTAGNGGPYCEGFTPVELSSVPAGGSGVYTHSWTGPDGFTSSDQNPNRGEATVDMTGTYMVIVTDNNGCASDPATTDLVVNAQPNASAANDGPKCGNGNEDITLFGDPNGMDSYEWFAPGDDPSTDVPIGTTQDFVLSNVLPANSGIYTLRVENSNGCENITTTEVIVNELPEVSLGSNLVTCIGQNVTLTATITNTTTGSYTYTWYVDNGSGWTQLDSGVDMNTYSIADVQLSDEASYSVIVNDGNTCASPRDAMLLTVNELPTATPSATDICAGIDNNILLEGGPDNPDYSYSWSGPGLTGSVAGQDVTVTDDAVTDTPGTYTYTLTTTNTVTSCSNSATVDVEVFENPAVTIDPVTEICDGGKFTVNANVSGGSGTYDFSWTFDDGSGAVALVYNTNTFTVDPAGLSDAGTYEVTVTDTGNPTGCTSTASVAVVVNELPTVTLPDAATCDGQQVTLTAAAQDGSGNYVNYTWYDGSGTVIPGSTTNQLTLTGTDVALANDGATYSVTVEDDNGCVSAADDMTLTVNENPTVEIQYEGSVETAIDVCLGTSMTLDAQGSGGTGTYNYTWTLPDGSTQAGAQLVINPMALTDDGVYTVTVDDGNTCEGTQTIDVTVVEVTATIAVTAPAAGATTICENTSVTFEAGGGDNYKFYHFDASTVTTTMVHDTSNEWTTSTLEDGDEVYVTATNALLGCSDDSDPITMSVNANPTVAITYPAGEDNEICVGEDLPVIADPSGYANYDFYVSDGTTDTKVSPDGYASETFTYSASDLDDGYEIYVVASSGAGCSGESARETVVVHTLPNATADNTGPECVNQTVTLQGGDAGLDSYEWFAPGADLTTDAPIATSMDHELTNIASSDAGIYTLRVTNVNSCQATATTEVVVNELPVVSLPADYAVCEGTQNHEVDATITNGTAPYEVVWEFDDGSGSPIEVLRETLTVEGESTYTIGTVAAANAGTYTVTVTDANGCVSVQDELVLTVSSAPGVSFDASSVNEVCQGSQVSLVAVGNGGVVSGADASAYEYVWYYEGTIINGVSTATYEFAGNNGVNDGLYEVIAIDDNGNGCGSPVASMNVTVHELPDATLDVDPAFFIEGTEVTFTAVTGYDNYDFSIEGTVVQSGTNNIYTNADLNDGDEVTVTVSEIHSPELTCSNSSTVTMTVFDSVDTPVVSVTDEEYCAGSAGATVNVTNPQQDVTYELVYDDGSPVSGYAQIVYDGTNPVSWSGVLDDNGGTSTPTTFRVKAFWATLTPTGDQLSVSFDVTEHPVPTAHTMSVDGASAAAGITVSDCNSGSGYVIGLNDGWQSIDYTLLLNGSQVLEIKNGGGVVSEFTFDNTYSIVGEYTIVAQNEHGCTTNILGSFIIEGDAVSIFDLSGENNGQYCDGDADGVELTLSGSETGVDYELFRDGASLGTFVGDGNPLSFGNFTDEGIYRVSVTTGGGCIYLMNNDVTVEMVAAPDAGTLTDANSNNFHFCEGAEGVDIYQDVVQIENYIYELIGPEGVVITHTGDNSGTGITYDDITVPGEYFVRVTSAEAIGCSAETDVVEVVEDALPNVETVQQYTELCDISGSTALIGIDNSQNNVEYQWVDVLDNTNAGPWTPGTGGSLELVVDAAGEYLIQARNTQSGCEVEMDGTVTVELRPLPASDITVTETGGTDCTDGLVLTLDNPEAGVVYQLYKEDISGDPVYVQDPVSGDGTVALPFEAIVDRSADYYILATSEYGCPVVLDGSPWNVDIAGAVEKFALRPETGDICNGEDGVSFYLENSEVGTQYVLSLEGAGDSRNDTVTSTGGMVEFAPVLEEGTYYVTGLSASDENCNSEMLNRVELVVRPLPKAFNMIGPGTYCDATKGVTLGIDNSQAGFEYLLQQHTSAGKRNIERFISSTEGDTIQFTTALFEEATDNIYSVVSISPFGCTSSMKDSVEVKLNDLLTTPVIVDNMGADNDTVYFCDISGEYYTIQLDAPQLDDGILYQVIDEDGIVVAESIVEAGAMEPLNVVDPGTYSVRASWDDGGCMTGEDVIQVEGSVPAEDLHEPVYPTRICSGDTATIKYPDNTFGWDYTLMSIVGSVEEVATFIARDTINNATGNDTIVWKVDTEGRYFINIQSEGGACEPVPTSNIDIQIADPIQMASFTATTYNYCHNADRVEIAIENVPQTGNFVYRLIDVDGNTYGAVFNDDAEYLFSPLVGEGTPTAYGLLGKDIDSGCEARMDVADFAEIVQFPVPVMYEIVEDTIIFDPESDIIYEVNLTDYEDRVIYDMYYEFSDEVFSSTADENFSIPVSSIDEEGDYYIFARHLDAPDCEPIEIGSVFLKEKGITPFEFTLAEGRTNYCEGEVVKIYLSNSQPGVEYQLFRDDQPIGNRIISYQTGNPITFSDDSYMGVVSFVDGSVEVKYDVIGFFSDEEPVSMTPDGEAITATIWERPDVKNIWMESQNGEVSLGGQCLPNQTINVVVESPDINNRYFVEFIDTDELHLEGYAFEKLDSIDVNDFRDEIDFGVDTAGYYRISVSNAGCRNQILEDTVQVRQFRDPIAEDFMMKIPSDQILGVINVMENAITDPLLDIDDYKYVLEYPVPSDTVIFSWIDADVEFNYDAYIGKRPEWNSPFIQYTRPAGFVGKDSVRYSINIGVCLESKIDTGLITVIVGNEKLPNEEEVLIPNAFSPNGDGMNDYFVLSGIPDEGQTTLTVFNRWGNLVYESKGRKYQNDWDGTSNVSNMVSIGEDLPNGVYFYVISVKMTVDTKLKTKEYNGFIELRR